MTAVASYDMGLSLNIPSRHARKPLLPCKQCVPCSAKRAPPPAFGRTHKLIEREHTDNQQHSARERPLLPLVAAAAAHPHPASRRVAGSPRELELAGLQASVILVVHSTQHRQAVVYDTTGGNSYLRCGSDLRRNRVTVPVQGGAVSPSIQMLPCLFV